MNQETITPIAALSTSSHAAKPKLLVVGGCDVDRRIDLMLALRPSFRVSAAGSRADLADRFSRAGLPFFYYPLERGSRVLGDARSTVSLYRLFRRLQPDIVHTFATKPCVWGRIAACWAGVPVVVGTLPGLGSLYSSQDWRTRLIRGVYQPLQRAACRWSSLTIFQNHRDAMQLVKAGVTPPDTWALVKGSGVRTDIFDPSKVDPALIGRLQGEVGTSFGAQSIVITMVSRLIRTKGVLEFAEAARRVHKQYPSVRFLLVGPEDHGSRDRLTSEELGRVRSLVTCLGERQDIVEILASSDIFVLPSTYREGMPRVLLEAASMGLPLVTTEGPGCADIVQHGVNGLCVPPGDARALALALCALIEQPDLREQFSEASRARAIREYDLKIVVKELADLYRKLLENRKPLNVSQCSASGDATLNCS